MRPFRIGALGLALCAAAGCVGNRSSSGRPTPVPPPVVTGRAALRTVAETTSYSRTSTYDDVMRFLQELSSTARVGGATVRLDSLGRTTEGRAIPYVVVSRSFVPTPTIAIRSTKPVVYVQANIHAGEVEGKEALLALLRDLAFAPAPNVLDSIVIVAVPIYNADGNERFGPQSKQRTEQNGPELVGQRPNGQGLDLNRDYVKVEAPETRASLAMLNAWNPDVFVDLHTTDGSFHGYALTYSPSLNPAAPLGDYTRTLLAELRRRVHDRAGYETFDYGNFSDAFGSEVSTDTGHAGWFTYDHRPRFGTNYYGLRGRIGVLSEAYSHDPFERRVKSTYAFVKELLSLVAERREELLSRTRPAQTLASSPRDSIGLRAELPKTAAPQPVIFEVLARTGDSSLTQPGVPRGLRRTGEFRTRMMPVFDRFFPTLVRPLPPYYALPTVDTAVIQRLRDHGVSVRPATATDFVSSAFAKHPEMAEFIVDSVIRSPRAFQGHREVRVVGHWQKASDLRTDGGPSPGTSAALTIVPTDQPLGRLAAYLLDPESDDSFTTWNMFDAELAVGRAHPVRRSALP